MMMGVIAILGSALVYRDYYQAKTESRFHNRLLSRLKAREVTVEEILALEYVPREIISYLRNNGVLTVQQKK
jgi:histidinol phosphatase-like enzyme